MNWSFYRSKAPDGMGPTTRRCYGLSAVPAGNARDLWVCDDATGIWTEMVNPCWDFQDKFGLPSGTDEESYVAAMRGYCRQLRQVSALRISLLPGDRVKIRRFLREREAEKA
jgi:hypothetical protein